MTQDQVIEVLRKVIAENSNFTTWTVSTPHLVALVNHAVEAEREACAKIIENILLSEGANEYEIIFRGVEEIRARGQNG